MDFTFDMGVIKKVAEEIRKAKKYVKIAIFQIHNEDIYNSLEMVLKNNVNVEIFTLPYDSINEKIRDKVKSRMEKIKGYGANLYFSRWGVGDPERTTTAVGRWYSFHGKFIVTEKAAIALSANFTENPELDAMLIYHEKEKIKEFEDKFDYLVNLFEKDEIKNVLINNPEIFSAPRTISDETLISHWIKDYPVEICNKYQDEIKEGIYVSPFDYNARNLFKNIIDDADEYVYISTESFTDTDIIPFLILNAIKGKVIKILTGSESQDFNERIRELYPRLLANGIELRKPENPLHAKLLITDKILIVSSVNLNKMNLGYSRSKSLWRANTETINIEFSKSIIENAKSNFDEKFDNSISLVKYLSKKEEDYAGSIFKLYGVKINRSAKNLFANFIVQSDIKLKKDLYKIGNYASILVIKFKRENNTIDTSDFLCTMVLYYLSDRKHTESELYEKLSDIYMSVDINFITSKLLEYKLIVKDDDFFKLDIKTLLGDKNE